MECRRCRCTPQTVQAHNPQPTSVCMSHDFLVSQHPNCTLVVRVEAPVAQAEGAATPKGAKPGEWDRKFKVTGRGDWDWEREWEGKGEEDQDVTGSDCE